MINIQKAKMEQSKIKILWIDDDIFRLKLRPYIDELEDSGLFKVVGVANPDDIEKSLAENADVKCIIVDISMPTGKDIDVGEAKMGMRTGLLVLKKLNEDSNLTAIKKVVFTIVTDEQVKAYCESNGIKCLIKQSFLTDTFLEEIKKIINEEKSKSN